MLHALVYVLMMKDVPFSDPAAGSTPNRASSCPRPSPGVKCLPDAPVPGRRSLTRWNDCTWPLVAANRPDLHTVQIGLAGFVHTQVAAWNLLMAGVVIAAVPMLVVYTIAQPYFAQSLSALGPVKE